MEGIERPTWGDVDVDVDTDVAWRRRIPPRFAGGEKAFRGPIRAHDGGIHGLRRDAI